MGFIDTFANLTGGVASNITGGQVTGTAVGTSVDSFIRSFNMFGMGSDPLIIAFSLMVAIGVTQNEMRVKNYSNTVMMFLVTYIAFFSVQWATSLPLLITFVILGVIGIVFPEANRTFREA